MIATSYPRDEGDWQGLFIRKIADALASDESIDLSLWAPQGPHHEAVSDVCSSEDAVWLAEMAEQGGMAHLLRSRPVKGLVVAGSLLRRLRRLYQHHAEATNIYHINWLQNALPLYGLNAKAVICILGTDFKLLKLPGMVALLRRVLATNQCILAPNAVWMQPSLERWFGDLAAIHPVNFGIDESWYQVPYTPPGRENHWLCVLRITKDKIGPLFEWGEQVFRGSQQLHLIGPNQDGLEIPDWVHYHGPVAARELAEKWFPLSCGFITLSQHSEGKPQVLLETIAAGRPVIASPIAAHQETVEHAKQGYLVDSIEQLEEAVALMTEPQKHRTMSENCRESRKRDYGTWADCAARYKKLYGMLQ